MAGRYLVYSQRKEIERLYAQDYRMDKIAEIIGVTPATIYREIKRGETAELNDHFRPAYSAEVAEREIRRSMRNRGRKKQREAT